MAVEGQAAEVIPWQGVSTSATFLPYDVAWHPSTARYRPHSATGIREIDWFRKKSIGLILFTFLWVDKINVYQVR